jgi:hypothetical protein
VTVIQQPIIEIPCGHCDRLIHLQGGQIVICCDVAYSMEVLLKTELERDRIARIYEVNQALGLLGATQPPPTEQPDGL